MDLINWCVVEESSSSWTEQGDDCIGLGTDLFTNQFFLSPWPDGENTSDSEVVDHNRASIQRIEGDVVTFSLTVKLFQLRSLLAGEPLDQRVFLEVLFDDLVSMNVLLQLSVTELVGRLKNDDG